MRLLSILLFAFPALVLIGLDSLAVFLVCIFYALSLYKPNNPAMMNSLFKSKSFFFVLILIFSVLASNVAYGNAPRFIKYSAYYIGFFAIFTLSSRISNDRQLRLSILFFLACNVIFGIGQIIVGKPVFYHPPVDLKLLNETSARFFGQYAWSDTGRGIRPNGFYLYPTSYGFGLVLSSSLLFLHSRNAAGISGVMLGFMSLTRNSAVASLAGLAFDYFSRQIRRSNIRIALFSAVSILIFVIYFSIFSTGDAGSVGDYIGKIFGRGRSAGESTISRAKLYADTLRDFYENNAVFPFFGYSDVKGSVLLGQRTLPLGSHSTFLAALYRFGVVGFLAFSALLVSMGNKTIRAGRGGLMVALLMMMVTEDILIDPINLLIAGAALGLLSRDSSIRRNMVTISHRGRSAALLLGHTTTPSRNNV